MSSSRLLPAIVVPLTVALLGCRSARPGSASAASKPQAGPQFTDVAEQIGLSFVHARGGKPPVNILQTTGSGCVLFDADGDGDLDAFFVTSARAGEFPQVTTTNALFENLGNGHFRDITRQAGLEGHGYGMGCVAGDYDGDGDLDLYVTNYGRNILYRNDGHAKFTDVTEAAGVGGKAEEWSSGAVFADFDGDGNLDLYVANYLVWNPKLNLCRFRGIPSACPPTYYDPQPNHLYHNNGHGTFSEVTAKAGVGNPDGKSLGVIALDYDEDGHMDLYVANDGTPNRLYHNRGDGTFEDVTVQAGVGYDEGGQAQAGMGVDCADVDGDGRLDLVVTNFHHEYNVLYHNDGGGLFSDWTHRAGLYEGTLLHLAFGVGFLDYDNDGDQDLFFGNGHVQDNIHQIDETATYAQRPQLYQNDGLGHFRDVSEQAGPGFARPLVCRGAAFGDFDDDGDTDILLNNSGCHCALLRNDGGNRAHWIRLELVGKGLNRFAVGADVQVTVGGQHQRRQIRCGSGYISQSDLRLLFGLGQALQADRVVVRWPSGKPEQWSALPADRPHQLVQGQGKPVGGV